METIVLPRAARPKEKQVKSGSRYCSIAIDSFSYAPFDSITSKSFSSKYYSLKGYEYRSATVVYATMIGVRELWLYDAVP